MSEPQHPYPESWRAADIARIEAMFQEARTKGLWFYCNNLGGEHWFSPAELRREHANGKLFWSAENWTLRDPLEGVDAYEKKIAQTMNERNAFVKRVTTLRFGDR